MVSRIQTDGCLHAKLKELRNKGEREEETFPNYTGVLAEVLRFVEMMHNYGEHLTKYFTKQVIVDAFFERLDPENGYIPEQPRVLRRSRLEEQSESSEDDKVDD